MKVINVSQQILENPYNFLENCLNNQTFLLGAFWVNTGGLPLRFGILICVLGIVFIFAEFFQNLSKPWWVEIITIKPHCTYYFGPFPNWANAKAAHSGYVEDLESEGAQIKNIIIKRCQPASLTICDD